MMKKLIVFAALLLVSVMVCACALAVSPTFDNTRRVMDGLDSENIRYTLIGLTDDKEDEQIKVSYSGENMDSIDLNIYVGADNDYIRIYCWDIITFDESALPQLVSVVNDLNKEWAYIKFTCDSDNTVTARFNAYAFGDGVGKIASEMVDSIVYVVDEAYPSLAPFNK